MYNTLKNFNSKRTPQTQPVLGKNQVKSRSGGYVFRLTDWEALDRFLILGSNGTYYANGTTLTRESAEVVARLLKDDGVETVHRIKEISESGRAPRNDPALFALAMACSPDFANSKTRRYAFDILPLVARTSTHLFHFAQFVTGFRGWGRGLRDGVANWYQFMPLEKLAYQVTKYQSRDGWSHVDLLRLSHPKPINSDWQAMYDYIVNGWDKQFEPDNNWHSRIWAHEQTRLVEKDCDIIDLIEKYGLTWESIPTEYLNSPAVWEALLQSMPIWAMVRNLAKMSSIGLVKPFSKATKKVVEALGDTSTIKSSRIHPMTIGLGLLTYRMGHGYRGSLTWEPVSQVLDALEGAFYSSFDNVNQTNHNIIVAIDVSGSMGVAASGYPISCSEAAAMMALLTVKTEPNCQVVFYDTSLKTNIGGHTITASSSLADAWNIMFTGGGTDCAKPIEWATQNQLDADFILLSDSHSWAGDQHVFQALQEHRNKVGNSKLVVANMAWNLGTVADPEDAGSLNCVGLDANLPSVIADFLTQTML